jgi:hypothetical protein
MTNVSRRRLLRSAAATAVVLLALSAEPAFAQMGFSFYTNMTIDSDGRVYTDVTGYDNTGSACIHSGYSLSAKLYGPLGGQVTGTGYLFASANLENDDGDYISIASLRLTCSCNGNSQITVGGPGSNQTAPRTRHRAVFQYSHPNGDGYQYNAMCTHSCQPSKVCLMNQNTYAYFNGFKLVTPVATRCTEGPIYTTSGFPGCVGTGTGLWTSFNSGCQF